VLVYEPSDTDMLEDSSHTLWACQYLGSANLHVIPMQDIISLVSMQMLSWMPDSDEPELWFAVEKSGLDDCELTGYVDPVYVDNTI